MIKYYQAPSRWWSGVYLYFASYGLSLEDKKCLSKDLWIYNKFEEITKDQIPPKRTIISCGIRQEDMTNRFIRMDREKLPIAV